MRNIFVF